MSDPRRERKPRQLRGKITAGITDLDTFKEYLTDFVDTEGWDLTFEDTKRRGDYGPLHDYTFGLVESLEP
jgi:hypothetical protein